MKRQLALVATLAAFALPAAGQRLAVNPVLPSYGTNIVIELKDAAWPIYLPATRYARSGNTIYVDYEYLHDGFGPARPDFGSSQLSLGELPPGNYNVQARLISIDDPKSDAAVVSTNVPVMPPQDWGIYTVPREPLAFAPAQATIRSAAYFDPATMQASVNGNVVRVEFVYRNDAPAMGSTPTGMSTFGSVAMPQLPPGSYVLEGWGRATTGSTYERFFTKAFQVTSAAPVVEFYSASLDHYFVSAGADEIALLDRGGQGDWKRTGQEMRAWLRAADAPPGAAKVCRFYAKGPNSHFYTASGQECDYLRTLERDQRAEAAAKGQPFLGWAYETVAFWAVMPQNGQCPGGLRPVYRAYNNRALQMDSNHRLMVDPTQRAAMMVGWLDEGVQLCSAG
jgi:hypothetical protein